MGGVHIVILLVAISVVRNCYGIETEIANSGLLDFVTKHKVLYEAQNFTTNAVLDENFMEVNQLPVRYDKAQLWRVYNVSRLSENVPSDLERTFGGDVWMKNTKFLDIAFQRENLRGAREYLKTLNLTSEILNTDIQKLIDEERSPDNVTNLARTKKSTDTIPPLTWNSYHNLNVIYKFLRTVRDQNPEICQLYSIGRSVEGRKLKVLRIGESKTTDKAIWIDGGIHAREWISPAVVTFIINHFITNWSTLPTSITSKTWYFMPMMNPDGYAYSRTTNRMWRKNRSLNGGSLCRGVDLNRNFDIGWEGPGSSSNPCSDIYRGPKAESEPESIAVAEFLRKRKSHIGSYLTFHSYGQMIVYPWAYKAALVNDHEQLQTVAQLAAKKAKETSGTNYIASVTHRILGIAGGGSDDWARAELKIKYVYTIELRDTGNHGFLLPQNQIKPTSMEGLAMVKTIADFVQ